MPAVIPILGTLFSVIGGGIGAGEAIASAVGGPPKVTTPPTFPTGATPKITPATVAAENNNTGADIQARGGGSLAPLYAQLFDPQNQSGSGSSGGGGVPYTGA